MTTDAESSPNAKDAGCGKPAYSRRRRWIFRVSVVVCAFVILEFACHLVIWIGHGGLAVVADCRDRAANIKPQRPFVVPAAFVLHPYIGAVLQPVDAHDPDSEKRPYVNDFGFRGRTLPLQKRSSETVVLGILGGSVASEFQQETGTLLAEELSRIPQYSGRTFVIVPLAMDGYKQPQQLMIVSYLLSLGAEFDILVNLDGVNEAALPVMDNIPHGVFAAFPRGWNELISTATGIELKRRIGYVTYLRSELNEQARLYCRAPLRLSSTATLVWKLWHDRTQRRILAEIPEIQRLSEAETSYCASGPQQQFENRKEMFAHSVDIWFRSSRLIHDLCAANGIQYFHFLQPNQYVANSKPMTKAEQELAIHEKSPFREPVINCYPLMQKQGRTLVSGGVQFHDLTHVFSETNPAVYRDDCCHFHEAGHVIIARAMADRIAASFQKSR